MINRVVVCLAMTLLSANAGRGQGDDWKELMDRGQVQEKAADYAGALASYEKAAEVSERAAANDPRRLISWNSVASMYDALGQFPDAERSYRRALAAAEKSRGKDSAEYPVVLASLGSLYIEMGQTARGETMLRESLAIQETSPSRDEARLAMGRVCLAEALLATGRYQEPERLLTAALAVWEKHPDAWRERGIILNNLGVVELYQKRYVEAQRLLERSLLMLEEGLTPDHPMLVRVLSNQATVFSRTGRRPEASEKLRRALEIVDKHLGADHPVNGVLLRNYAALLRQSGDKASARKAEARSAEVLKQSALRNGAGMVVDISAFPRK